MKEQAWNKLRDKAGFTLVELIVVIAILGILAGIGTVGYSGYIKKANQAADEQLRGYVNSAFAAACVENGIDMKDVNSATLSLTGTDGAKKVQSVSPYDNEFQKYYAGNENSVFKVFTNLIFDAEKHAFVDPVTAGEVSMAYGGGVVKISSEDAAKLADSTFITAAGLGVNGLLNKVNEVADFAALFSTSGALDTVFSSPSFQAYAAAAMGISMEGKTSEQIMAEFGAKQDELVAQMVASGKAPNTATATQKLLANAAILFAANNATQMNQADISTLLSNAGARDQIVADLGTDTGKALSEAALAYGMYTAYAYSTGDELKIAATSNPVNILNGLEDADFQNYIKSNQGSTDLTGYLSALNMINNSTGDTLAVSNLLISGFNDDALKAILNQAVQG